jgi:hypothetical protein
MMGIASKQNVGDSGMSTAKRGFKRALGMSQENSENVSSLLNRDAGKAITEKAGRQKAKSAAPAPAPKEANKGTQVSLFFHGFLQLHQCLTSPSLSPLSITVQKFKAHNKGPAAGCVWHPLEPSTAFTCGWDGIIKMWE